MSDETPGMTNPTGLPDAYLIVICHVVLTKHGGDRQNVDDIYSGLTGEMGKWGMAMHEIKHALKLYDMPSENEANKAFFRAFSDMLRAILDGEHPSDWLIDLAAKHNTENLTSSDHA